MAEDTPNLADYLKAQRNNAAPCWCVDAPPDVVAQVDAVLDAAEEAIAAADRAGTKRPSPQWAGITRWISKQLDGVKLGKFALQKHREHRANG